MKKLLGLAVIAGLSVATVVVAGEKPTAEPQKFGAPITVKKATPVEKIAKDPVKYTGKTVKIEGTVKDVCQGMGCWVEVQNDKGVSFMARSLDESVLVPKDIKGRQIVVQGTIKPLPRAQAEEPKEEGHACPKPEYVLATEGVELP